MVDCSARVPTERAPSSIVKNLQTVSKPLVVSGFRLRVKLRRTAVALAEAVSRIFRVLKPLVDPQAAIQHATETPKSGDTSRLAAACKRALVPGLLCASLAIIASSDALYSGLLWFLTSAEAIIRTHPVSGILLFVVFAAVSAMLAFVSAAVITPVAIHTWGNHSACSFCGAAGRWAESARMASAGS